MSNIICPYCTGYERCKEMGWDDAERCVNFVRRDDVFDMKPLFEAAKGSDEVLTVEMPTNRPNDAVDISLFIPDDSKWAVGKINAEDFMSNTLQFDRCDRVIFRDRTLDFQFEIGRDQYKDIDTIIVNGVKFVKEN